jgi:hypothetical protein
MNVSIHECALSSSNSNATFRFDPLNTGIGTVESRNKLDKNDGVGAVVEIVVPVRRLDDFVLDKTTFIKIDVEGHEMEVLKGASKIICRDKPVFLIEIEERHCPGNTTLVPNWLNELGYRSFVLNRSTQTLVSCPSVAESAEKGVNNFWFIAERQMNHSI